jgi:hypothetical protein
MVLHITRAQTPQRWHRRAIWPSAGFFYFPASRRPPRSSKLHRQHGNSAGPRAANISTSCSATARCPPGFRTIDNFTNGIATSIKSIDLNAATYRAATRLVSRLTKCTADMAEYEGGSFANKKVLSEEITGRAVNLVVPKGSMTEEQRIAIEKPCGRLPKLARYP